MTQKVVRQFADRNAAVADEAKKGMEQAYATASKGAINFNLQLIDMAHENMNAAFDFARQLSHVKSPTEFFELSTAHAKKQMQILAEQTQRLTAAAQKATTEAAEPFAKTFK